VAKREGELADVVLHPDTSGLFWLELHKADEFAKRGEIEARNNLGKIWQLVNEYIRIYQGGEMKKRSLCVLPVICCLLPVFLYGCATVKEAAKGFAGVSTKVLEEGRKDGLRESFPMGYSDCYARVKDILEEKFEDEIGKRLTGTEVQSYIYAGRPAEKYDRHLSFGD
jgi:hypothetical protein